MMKTYPTCLSIDEARHKADKKDHLQKRPEQATERMRGEPSGIWFIIDLEIIYISFFTVLWGLGKTGTNASQIFDFLIERLAW